MMKLSSVPCSSWLSLATVSACFVLLSGGLLVLFTSASNKTLEKRSHPLSRQKRYYEEENCHTSMEVNRQAGIFTSPEYPNSYLSNSNCSWLLTAPIGSTIRLFLPEVDLEETKDCLYDYVEVFDGLDATSVSLGRLCGQMTNRRFESTSNEMLVVFISDPNYEEKGFKAEYALEISDACNSTLTELEGVVTSPQYPNNYPDNTDCWTVIKAPSPDDRIKLNFALLEIEPADDCSFDFVEIFDGTTPDSPSVGLPFCDKHNEDPILSSGDGFVIYFHSDQLVTAKGFVLLYEIITNFKPTQNPGYGDCSWQMNTLNGSIASPNYPNNYQPEQICEIILEAPPEYQIKLIFDADVVMEEDDNCQFDHVEIRDGNLPDDRLLGKYCGGTPGGTSVRSDSNHMYIRFSSDDSAQFKGFSAHYFIQSRNYVKEEEKGLEPLEEDSEESASDTALDEMEPLFFDWIERPQNVSVNEGRSHILTCRNSDEKVMVTWLKDSRLLHSYRELPSGLSLLSNSSLVIDNMSWRLEGTYTCVMIGKKHVMSSSAYVSLGSHGWNQCNIKFDSMPSNISLIEGGHGFLSCFAGNAATTWLRDGEPLMKTSRILQLPYGFLLLSKARVDDDGVYSCVAIHKQTNCTLQLDATVKVIAKPDIGRLCGRPRLNEPQTLKPHLKRGKIVGGNDAKVGSAPWQVMLWEGEAGEFCGGSLLNAQWVLTAAHCIIFFSDKFGRILHPTQLILKMGKRDRTRKEVHEALVQAEEFFVHPEFSQTTYDNDIALIRMKNPVDFTDHILPICLGSEALLDNHIYEKPLMGTVTGWGLITEAGARPRYLQEIRLPLIDSDTCKKSTKQFFSDRMFCAGYDQEILGDACKGDSGGPYSVKIPAHNRWYIAGIVSWGEGCAKEGQYGFYTKVGKYHKWIQNLINDK